MIRRACFISVQSGLLEYHIQRSANFRHKLNSYYSRSTILLNAQVLDIFATRQELTYYPVVLSAASLVNCSHITKHDDYLPLSILPSDILSLLVRPKPNKNVKSASLSMATRFSPTLHCKNVSARSEDFVLSPYYCNEPGVLL